MAVYAFKPNQNEPAEYLAEDEDELREKNGERVGGQQCDVCGNSEYELNTSGNSLLRHGDARCTRCGQRWRISLQDDADVVFPW